DIERGFLSQKGSGKGIGVKEKDTNGSNIKVAKDGTLNEVTPVSALMEGVTSSVVDMDVEKDKLSSLEDTTILGSFSPLLTQQLNENLLKEDVSTVPVWVKLHGVPVMAFSNDGLSAIATKLGTPLMLDSYTSDICMQSWGRSSYARVIMIDLRADVELKDNIVVAMLRIKGDGHCTCNVRVEYE
nr:hypothetical protein [Tanacetum cinerariifolium]